MHRPMHGPGWYRASAALRPWDPRRLAPSGSAAEVLEHALQEVVLGDAELRLKRVLLVERAVGAPQQLAERLEHALARARHRREGRYVAPRRLDLFQRL